MSFPFSIHQSVIISTIIWNCRGAQSPNFCGVIRDMVQLYSPALMIITETKIGGPRAKAISDRLPFDGVIHTETIGLAGGLWVL